MIKRLPIVAALVAALVVGLTTAASATAANGPCWKRVVADWAGNGKIDGHYSIACLQATMSNMGEDKRIYSDLPDQVTRALQNEHGAEGVRYTASFKPHGPVGHALAALGPSKPASLPIPLLVLGGLALLLVGAGAAGLLARRVGSKRDR